MNSDVARPRMARYWKALTWPERGDERIRQEQEHSGLTRKQWKIRPMKERILQMQETSDIEVSGVLQKLIVSSPKELASDLEEGVLVLLSGVMEVAGDQAVGSVTCVPQALDAMPGDDWEEEDEESYYSDDEGDKEVSPHLARRGIGECVQLSESPWRRAVPDDLLEKYREWMRTTGGLGESKGVGVAEMLESLVEGGSLNAPIAIGNIEFNHIYPFALSQ